MEDDLCLIFSYCNKILNYPPDRKPRVAAWSFVHNIYDRKCVQREVSAHLNCILLFDFVSITWCCFVPTISWCGKGVFLGFTCPKKRGSRACRSVIFPCLPLEIGTVLTQQRLAYSLCCGFQHVFTHIDVTWCKCFVYTCFNLHLISSNQFHPGKII